MGEAGEPDAFAIIAARMDMIESYAISAVEAARRHDRHELEHRIRQIRKELVEAILIFKTIDQTTET